MGLGLDTRPDSDAGGDPARAVAPSSLAEWRRVLRETARSIGSDGVTLVAAGCAFYGTLALFPAISMLMTIYGLIFDPRAVEPQLRVLSGLLPSSAYTLIAGRVHVLVSHRPSALGLGLAISTAATLWTSALGTKSMLMALNHVYGAEERRSVLRFQLVSFGITLCALFSAALALAILVAMPAVFARVGLVGHVGGLIRACALAILVGFVLLSLALLYRFGPARRPAQWRLFSPGAVLATVLWLIASAAFTHIVTRLIQFDVVYGPFGTLAAIMLWFWVTSYVALLGAELNAALARESAGRGRR
jgi:membrane protein